MKRRRGGEEATKKGGEVAWKRGREKKGREEERKRGGCKSKVEVKRKEEESRILGEERRIDSSWRYPLRKSRPFIIIFQDKF